MDKYTRRISEGNLFKDELFIIPEKEDLNVEGTFDFPLLLLFNENNLTTENQEFLNSILKQIPNEETVSLINVGRIHLNQEKCAIVDLVNQYKPKYIFSWDCADLISGCPKDMLNPILLGDLGIIHCPKLADVAKDKTSKSELWMGMKVLFNIK